MIRTVVCEKEGCSGNKFYIEHVDDKLYAICKECGNKYTFDVGYYDFTIKNYYDAPRIYTITDPKTKSTWVDIGRNATHTQTKQDDIIKYIVKYE